MYILAYTNSLHSIAFHYSLKVMLCHSFYDSHKKMDRIRFVEVAKSPSTSEVDQNLSKKIQETINNYKRSFVIKSSF